MLVLYISFQFGDGVTYTHGMLSLVDISGHLRTWTAVTWTHCGKMGTWGHREDMMAIRIHTYTVGIGGGHGDMGTRQHADNGQLLKPKLPHPQVTTSHGTSEQLSRAQATPGPLVCKLAFCPAQVARAPGEVALPVPVQTWLHEAYSILVCII